MIKPIHWKFLRIVNRNTLGLAVSGVAYLARLLHDLDGVKRELDRMCEDEFDGSHPWLYNACGLYRVYGVSRDGELPTGGYKALDDASHNPHHTGYDIRGWMDRALTGMNQSGGQSNIQNAAIPKFERDVYARDPEQAAMDANIKFLGQFDTGFDPDYYSVCPDCDGAFDRTELRSDGKLCKKCDANRSRERRRRAKK